MCPVLLGLSRMAGLPMISSAPLIPPHKTSDFVVLPVPADGIVMVGHGNGRFFQFFPFGLSKNKYYHNNIPR
jgi:hypothetical protein